MSTITPHEVTFDGTRYSAFRLYDQDRWNVIAMTRVGAKDMKLQCSFDRHLVAEETRGELTEEAQAMTAIRLGYQKLKDQVRYHAEQAEGVDQLSRYDEDIEERMRRYDADVLAKAEEAERRQREAQEAERVRIKMLKEQEENDMIESAGELWGAF